MLQSKLIRLIRTLNNQEFEGFKYYLTCNHSSSEVLHRILDYLAIYRPDWEHPDLNMDIAFEQILKKKRTPKNKKHLSNHFSILLKYLKQFLLIEALKTPSFEQELLMTNILWKRGYFEESAKTLKRAQKRINNAEERGLWYFLNKMQISHFEYFHQMDKSLQNGQQHLKEAIQHLDNFYATAKLKYASEYKCRAQILNEQFEIPLLNEIFEWIKSQDNRPELAIFYCNLYQLFDQPEESVFDDLCKQVKQIQPLEKEEESLIPVQHLINFAIGEVKNGHQHYRKYIFELYQIIISHIEQQNLKLITPMQFINIVNIACSLKKYAWCEIFIQAKSNFLEYSIQKNIKHLALANLYFEKKEFDNTKVALSKIDGSIIPFTLKLKALEIRTYYELKEFLALDSYCKTFKIYLTQNKQLKTINPINRLSYSNLIKYILKFTRKNINPTKIKAEIETEKNLLFKSWLLEKTDELFTN